MATRQLELVDDDLKAVDESVPRREQARISAKLGILDIDPFEKPFVRFANSRLPVKAVMVDAIREFGVPANMAEKGAVTTSLFVVNLRFVGLLQFLAGADRIVTLDHLLDSLPSSVSVRRLYESCELVMGCRDNCLERLDLA